MFPDPDFGDYDIQGEKFTLMDGVVGLAHSANLGQLYFQPLATDRLFSVPTGVLKKGPLAEFEELPIALVGHKSSQGVGLTVDPRDDTIYFSPLTETAIASWQPGTNEQKVIAYDPTRLQFTSELRCAELDGGNIWGLSTRFQRFFKRQARAEEINLRIIRIPKSPRYHHFGFGYNNTVF
ncbi:yellow-e [Carabus blaptoides fortunei]